MNNLFIQMCLSFIKIGAFCFGGGYAAVGLIESEVVKTMHWLTPEQYINIIAIAEMTPGPIAANTATFAGYMMLGPVAGIFCTLSLILIPCVLALFTAFFFEKVKNNPKVQVAVKGIRPAAIGIIAAAGISIAKAGITDIWSIGLFAIAAFIIFKLKKSPIIALITCGALGIVIYGIIL